jgi:hypothetical protein
MTTTWRDFRVGDVVNYQPDPSRFDPTWCREGVALVEDHGNGHLDLLDTYWGADRIDTQAHCLSDAEIETAVLRFSRNDFRRLDRAEAGLWRDYAPVDRQTISAQHGLQCAWYVRKGAQPDLDTRIENAREKVADAESDVRAALSRKAHSERVLLELLKERNPQ